MVTGWYFERLKCFLETFPEFGNFGSGKILDIVGRDESI